MKTTLIIIGGGHLQVPLIKKAQQMQLQTIVFDLDGNAEGMQLADLPVIMSTQDVDGCVRQARALVAKGMNVHGVITAATDASKSVAAIANALDLAGISYITAKTASNKILMRQALEQAHLLVPLYKSVSSLAEARQAIECIGLPAVIKPAENMGARGVIKINRVQEIATVFRESKKYSNTGEMIIEEYLAGPELSIDALSYDGHIWITGIADRIFSNHPHYFVELGHNMPTSMPLDIIQAAEFITKKAVRHLGINCGAAKIDLKICNRGLVIGEIAARLSGGFMSSFTYPLSSQVDLYSAAIRICLNQYPFSHHEEYLIRNRKYPGGVSIERSICAQAGRITRLEGISDLNLNHNIKHVYIKKKIHDIMPPLKNNLDKLGHVVASGATVKEAEAHLHTALAKSFTIEVDQSYGVDWMQVEKTARSKFGENICWVCKVCDGKNCASGVPGMGGVGRMRSFQDNIQAFSEIKILPSYIHKNIDKIESGVELLGHYFTHPIMGAPLTGTITNMNLQMSEYEFARALLNSYRKTGSIAWLGDGASPQKFSTLLRAFIDEDSWSIFILKPRNDTKMLKQRIKEVEQAGAIAVGLDIDSVAFKTMQLAQQKAIARNSNDLLQLRLSTRLPFILKGVMNTRDAQLAINIGADAIVVSNHGGRILDEMPGTLRVLEQIVDAVDNRIPVLIDGGIRSGEDVFKALALGAKAVLIGRPSAIAVVGGGSLANQALINNYRQSLRQAMKICGIARIEEISSQFLFRYSLNQTNTKSIKDTHKKVFPSKDTNSISEN